MLPALTALALLGTADAAEKTFDASLGLSYFNIGLLLATHAGLKQPLPWQKPDSTLFGDANVHVQALWETSPAYTRVGGQVTFSPIAVLDLSGHALVSPYFGTFSTVIGFDDPGAAHTDEELEAGVEAGNRGTGLATRYGGSGTLKAKAGPVIVALDSEVARWNMRPADGVTGDYYFESQYEMLMRWQDTSVKSTAVVLYDQHFNEEQWLYIGPVFNHTTALGTGDTEAKVGLLSSYSTKGGTWNYLFVVQAFVEDRVWDGPFPPYLAARVKYTL